MPLQSRFAFTSSFTAKLVLTQLACKLCSDLCDLRKCLRRISELLEQMGFDMSCNSNYVSVTQSDLIFTCCVSQEAREISLTQAQTFTKPVILKCREVFLLKYEARIDICYFFCLSYGATVYSSRSAYFLFCRQSKNVTGPSMNLVLKSAR